MAQTVIGIFESSAKAQEAVQDLVENGITRDRIDVSSKGTNSGSSYSTNSAYSTTDRDDDDHHESGISRFFKSLFGDDDDDADKYTRVASHSQSIVTVHAQSGDEAERVADILDDNGAVDVDEHAAKLGYSSGSNYSGSTGTSVGTMDTNLGSTGTGLSSTGVSDNNNSNLATDTTIGLASVGGSTPSTSTTTDSDLAGTTANREYTDTDSNWGKDETRKIPIIEENVEVGKREVRTGGVRVRSRIVERPVEESVRLREEQVNVERNSVDRPATSEDLENFKERDIEMVERAEVPVVNKEARVVEEVSIGKEVEERKETIKDTVRKTEVDVENLEKDDVKDKYRDTDL